MSTNVEGTAELKKGTETGVGTCNAGASGDCAVTKTHIAGIETAVVYEGGEASLDRSDYHHFGSRGDVKACVNWLVEQFRGGRLIWADAFENLVVTSGLNKLLDATFKTGLASPAWYVGLVSNDPPPVYAAGDIAGSHVGWAEFTGYSETTRQAFTPGSIASGSVDNSASRAVFSINGAGTVIGFFLGTSNVKSGGGGTLYSVGAFVSSPDGRVVEADDILRVTATISISVD